MEIGLRPRETESLRWAAGQARLAAGGLSSMA